MAISGHSNHNFPEENGQKPQGVNFQVEKTPSESEEGWDLGWLFSVLRRRLFVMGGIFVAISSPVCFSLIVQDKEAIPIYQGSFELLVEPVTAESQLARLILRAQDPGDGIRQIDPNNFSLDYETQIRILRSPKMMAPVLQELQGKYPDLTHNILVKGLTISRVVYEKDGLEEGTKLLQIFYQHSDPEQVKLVLDKVSQAYLQYSLAERQTNLRQGVQFIDDQLPSLYERVDKFQKQLQTLRQRSNLINPETQGERLSRQFIVLEQQRVDTNTELAELRSQYQGVENQLLAGNPVAILSEYSDAYEVLLGRLQGLESDLAGESARLEETHPTLQTLQERHDNLQQIMLEESENILIRLADRIQVLEARNSALIQEKNILQGKISQLSVVARQYADLQRELKVAEDSLQQFLAKKEALEIDGAQNQIPWQLIAPPRLAQDAKGTLIPQTDSNLKRGLAIVIILSGLLSIGVGFVIEILDPVFHDADEIKAATKQNILAILPFEELQSTSLLKIPRLGGHPQTMKSSPLALVGQFSQKLWMYPQTSVQKVIYSTTQKVNRLFDSHDQLARYRASGFVEGVRSLYTNLYLLNQEQPLNSLTVCSPMVADGKTTVALNLAQILARVGNKVLLIDGDMRLPQLHLRLGLSNTYGLSDILTKDIRLKDAIQCLPYGTEDGLTQEGNLFALTAGVPQNDPIKLLSSPKMRSLVQEFPKMFDVVVYDTPPLVGLADGNLIAAQSQGAILVVGIEKTDRTFVKKSLDSLKNSGVPILGIVTNHLPRHVDRSQYYPYQMNNEQSKINNQKLTIKN